MRAEFWHGKRVLLTGHTGFKGSWCAEMLHSLGAKVRGLSIENCDIRDPLEVDVAVDISAPEIVIHMAAQAQVRESYRDPITTYSTNVMGTVNLLEALRATGTARVILLVTSDKVYANDDSGRAFTEGTPLGGSDPYSASKACVEMIARSYRESFGMPIATARAGNVIGGGDWSSDRLVPDIYRALAADKPVILRNPNSTRPWQHVLTCLDGYLRYCELLWRDPQTPRALNIGPSVSDRRTVGEMADALGVLWLPTSDPQPMEKRLLAIDCSMARKLLGDLPMIDAVQWTAEGYAGIPMHEQIARYLALDSQQMAAQRWL